MKTCFILLFSTLFYVSFSTAQGLSFQRDSSEIFFSSVKQDQSASFDGLTTYLNTHVLYPELARKNGKEGEVSVWAVIGEDGQVKSVELASGMGFGCDEAVMEMILKMPQWKPSLRNGKNVSQKVLIRVQFRLQ